MFLCEKLWCYIIFFFKVTLNGGGHPSSPENEHGVEIPLTAQALISPSTKRQVFRAQDGCPTSAIKPKRTGSLALFFRKVCINGTE